MAESKPETTTPPRVQQPRAENTQNADLRAENARLRAQLAALGHQPGPARAEHVFQLTEGARQELEIYGVAVIDGRQLTIDEVRDMLPENQRGVPLVDPPAETDRRGTLPPAAERAGIRGVDYVYPSVAPGVIDPAVAGLPGINGPAATEK